MGTAVALISIYFVFTDGSSVCRDGDSRSFDIYLRLFLVYSLQTAVQFAGMGTAVALQIKEMTLQYFEDRFAKWIIGQGGWVRNRSISSNNYTPDDIFYQYQN